MGQALFTNNAFSTLASGITDVATSITLNSGDGALFPSPTGGDYFYATLIDTANNLEIVQCTARSTDTLTVVRGAEGTTSQAYSAGDRIELRLTAAGITEADGYVGPTDETTDTTTFPLFVNSATGSQLPHTNSSLTYNSNTGALAATNLDGILGANTPAAVTGTTGTFSGVLSVDDTTDTTGGTDGSIHTDGGLGIAKKLYVGTSATISGVLTMGGNIVSDTDSTDDLGTNSVRWANIYVDAATVTNNATVGGNLTVTGDLTINGTTTTINTTNTVATDPLIELNNGASSNANDLGLIMERGSTGDNVWVGWDESADQFVAATTTATGSSTGNITTTSYVDVQFGTVNAVGATFSGTSSDLGTVTTIDINGGTIDGTNIGASVAGTGAFTTLTASTNLTLATGATVTGIADEDDMASNSATLLATQQSIKAYVDSLTPSPGIQMTWNTATTDADQGAGAIWADNATFASITTLYIDDVENNAVSINNFVDTLDDPTATNSAYLYITKAGSVSSDMKLFKVTGAVTSASTYSKVAVTPVVEVGTFSNSDTVGVVVSFSGDNGTGDLLAANNLSDVDDAATALNNLGGADIGLVIALGG